MYTIHGCTEPAALPLLLLYSTRQSTCESASERGGGGVCVRGCLLLLGCTLRRTATAHCCFSAWAHCNSPHSRAGGRGLRPVRVARSAVIGHRHTHTAHGGPWSTQRSRVASAGHGSGLCPVRMPTPTPGCPARGGTGTGQGPAAVCERARGACCGPHTNRLQQSREYSRMVIRAQ
jgi:hypothetical protein